jgi:hypothetical protein
LPACGAMRNSCASGMSIVVVFASLLLVTCSSCIESKHPASSLDTAVVDKRLIGLWVNAADSQHWFVIGKSNQAGTPKGLMTGMSAELTADGTFRGTPLALFVTQLGDNAYLNLAQAYGEEEGLDDSKGYFIIKYAVKDNTLTMVSADDDFIREEVKAGKIKGDQSEISDSTENLAKWLTENDEQVFPNTDVFTYNRMKKP